MAGCNIGWKGKALVNSNLPEQFCILCEGDAVLRKGVTFEVDSKGTSVMVHAMFSVCLICSHKRVVDNVE